jgi:hypothetical protein
MIFKPEDTENIKIISSSRRFNTDPILHKPPAARPEMCLLEYSFKEGKHTAEID